MDCVGESRNGVTSRRSGTVSLSRARYGVLAELYIVLLPLFSF